MFSPSFAAKACSMLNTTSAAVRASPSLQRRAGERLNVIVRSSFDTVQSPAIPGLSRPSLASTDSNVSYSVPAMVRSMVVPGRKGSIFVNRSSPMMTSGPVGVAVAVGEAVGGREAVTVGGTVGVAVGVRVPHPAASRTSRVEATARQNGQRARTGFSDEGCDSGMDFVNVV